MEICLVYISKYESNRKEQFPRLTIPNEKCWHYLAVTKLPPLLTEVIFKNDGDFYCLNCLYFIRTGRKEL